MPNFIAGVKANPPLAHWNPENLGLIFYCLISGIVILLATVGKAAAGDVGYGVLFVTLGVVGLIHSLWSRGRWLRAGGGSLPRQEEKAARYVSKYKPVLLWVGWAMILLFAIAGRLIPKESKDIVMPLVMGIWPIMGTAAHIAWHRARRWLAQQSPPTEPGTDRLP